MDLQAELAAETPGLGPIPVRQGLKQGCPCSPLLFSLLFNRVAAAMASCVSALGRGGHQHFYQYLGFLLCILLFADDVALIAEDASSLRTLFTAFHRFCMASHLTISPGKTKVLI